MNRPKQYPLSRAVMAALESITLGGGSMVVGDGVAPDCDPPYLIATGVPGGSFTGPLSAVDEDELARVQVRAVGVTREQAELALDLSRDVMTVALLQANYTGNGRRITNVELDVYRGGLTEGQGVPEPYFSEIDQYLVRTTPAPSL